jgi:hypothetical protein
MLIQSSRFRWVALQFDELRRCRSRYQVEQQLGHLPNNLYESYDRIIHRIDKRDHEDASKLFQWLAFSIRPLELNELAEVVAVDFESRDLPWFDCNRRYGNSEGILEVCSGFVSITEGMVDMITYEERFHSPNIRKDQTGSFLCEGVFALTICFVVILPHRNNFPLTYFQDVSGIPCAVR